MTVPDSYEQWWGEAGKSTAPYQGHKAPDHVRDEAVITQGLTTTLPPAQLTLDDGMAAWRRPV
ncbi:hypothetical protein ACF1CG_37870, partial [Streptomyces sp. NPDC014773]|uniref:hypothetical protein n=1 Tax=Streptomyces sp. NPDC014773 TaxID=3364908 RepID=UPI003702C144